MPQIASFPFTFIGKTLLGIIYRPYAIIHAYSKIRNKWQPIEVIIDTGADYTLFPKRYAQILGIDVEKDCKVATSLGIGGSETVYQYKDLPIKIANWKKNIPVGFLERDDIPPLLGRLSCLEFLRMVFEKRTSIFQTGKS